MNKPDGEIMSFGQVPLGVPFRYKGKTYRRIDAIKAVTEGDESIEIIEPDTQVIVDWRAQAHG